MNRPNMQQPVAYIEFMNQGGDLPRTVRYGYYSKSGHAANITVMDDEAETYKDLYLVYTEHGRLWLAIWQSWAAENDPPAAGQISVDDIWEFRYDGGRQRYLAKRWDFDPEGNPMFTPDPNSDPLWTDYLGQQPYVDYTLSGVTVDEQTRYLAGMGVHAQQVVDNDTDPITYLHGDLTRSTMMTTDESGSAVSGAIYTAFGEPVTYDAVEGWRVGFPEDIGSRYGYDGGWGYESGLITLWGEDTTLPPVTLQHVGERWYQPGIGRFIQRDPVGLWGGLNVYAYTENVAVNAVDPDGESSTIHIGDPSPTNPGGYPRPPGSRIRINFHPRVPIPPPTPWYLPSFPVTPAVGGAVCVVFVGGYVGGRALDRWHPGTPDPYSEHIGRWIHKEFFPKPPGLVVKPNGDMVLR